MKCSRCKTHLTPHSIGRRKDPTTGIILTCRWCEAELEAACMVCGNPLITVAERQDGRCKGCEAATTVTQ